MELQILRATLADFDEIFALYKLSIKAMVDKGIFQWDAEYPSATDLQENLVANSVWVMTKEKTIVASVTLDNNQDEQYQNIKWAYPSNNLMVIHRLVTHPAFQGMGIAKKMMLFSEEYANNNGYDVIRLDAYLGNSASQNLYKKLGYIEAIGYCYYHPKMIMCNCFEKQIKM